MRYYPCKLNLDNFHHTLSGCIQTTYTDSLLLTKHGFYKYIGDELYKYKISMDKKEDIVLKKYIHNISHATTLSSHSYFPKLLNHLYINYFSTND